MNYNKEDLKEKAIKLYLSDNTYEQIGEKLGYSKEYINSLIRDDERIKEKRNTRIIKVPKMKRTGRIRLPISIDFMSKIGIDRNPEKEDFVEIKYDEKNNRIIIKKANM